MEENEDTQGFEEPEAGTEAGEIEQEEAQDPTPQETIANKFKTLFEGLTEEEREVMAEVTREIPGLGPLPGFIPPSGHTEFPYQGARPLSEEWIELQGGYAPSPEEIAAGESAAQYGVPFPGIFPGMPYLEAAFGDSTWAKGFQPGAEEKFTLGGEERDQRQLEAAVDEADALRARIKNAENARQGKISLFKGVVVGGLHWLIEKIEGAPEPLPERPVVQAASNGGLFGARPEVMAAFQDEALAEQLAAGPMPHVGAPGEGF